MTEHAASPTSEAFSTDAWRSRASSSWLANADRLEAMLDPVLDPIFERAELCVGERVLDVGCGRGETARRAAVMVGGGGAVTAVDVAESLIDAAGRIEVPADAAPIEWLAQDAQTASLPADHFDAVISRFGVMFFDDPVAAFANFGRATRPGGRLAVATWRPRDASPFQHAGYDAAVAALRDAGYEVTAGDPTSGPYSFGVDAHVHEVLSAAGWSDVVVHPVEMPLYFAGPGASAEQAVGVAIGMAGMQSFLAPLDDAATRIASEALLGVYQRAHDGTGVRLDAAMTVITARR